jgi:hypothetical protein
MLNTASFRKDAAAGRCEGCCSHFRNQPWKEPEQLTQSSPKTTVLKPGDMIGKQSMANRVSHEDVAENKRLVA